jgi:hypothetical protein
MQSGSGKRVVSVRRDFMKLAWTSQPKFIAIVLSSLIAFGASDCYAESSLSKLLIDDCPQVLAKTEKLSEPEKVALVKDLISVISFEISQTIDPPVALMPQPSISNVRTNSPWSAIQGGQTLQAKHCAIDALQLLNPASSEAIPELTRLGWNRTVPPDIRKLAQKATLDIVEAVEVANDYTLSTTTISQILALLDGEYRVAAQNTAIGLSSKILPGLLIELKSADAAYREKVFSLLTLVDPEGVQVLPVIKGLLSSSDPQLRKQSLGELLSYTQKLDQDLYVSIVKLLDDPSDDIQKEAARIMSEIVCSAARLQLGPLRGIDPRRWLSVVSRFRSCQPKELSISLAKLLPDGRLKTELGLWYASGGAAQRELAIDILAWAGDSDASSKRLALRALKDSEPSIRLSAVRALIQLSLVDAEVTRVLVGMLGDQEENVRRLIQDTLTQLGPKALEPLRSARTSTPLIKKIGVYYSLSRIDPKFSSAGLERELGAADCHSRLEIAIALATVKHGDLSQFIWDCREAAKDESRLWWDALSAAAPLSPAVKTHLTDYLNTKAVLPDALIQFVDHAQQLGFESDSVIDTFRQLLSSSDDLIRDQALTRIARLADQAKPLTADLKKLFEQLPKDNLLRHETAVTLILIDNTSLNYSEFFAQEFDSDRLNWAQASIAHLDANISRPILTKALAEVPHKRKFAVLRSIGNLGQVGKDLEQELIPWLDDDDPQIKYEATVALLKVRPTHPRSIDALRAELNAMFVERLSQELFPKEVLETLATIQTQSSHLAEKRRAAILLEALKNKG